MMPQQHAHVPGEESPPHSARRVVRAPRGRFIPGRIRAARPRRPSRPTPHANPVRAIWAEPGARTLPWPLAWALVALGIAGVVLALRIVARFPDGNWLAGLLLVLTVIALATVLARAGIAEPVRWRHRRSATAPARVYIPGILVFFAVVISAGAAIRRWEVDRGPAGWESVPPG